MAAALVLGGGGTPNPATELLLELALVVVALVWLWLPRSVERSKSASWDGFAMALVFVPLLIPVLQLVPLPPAIWTSLPGRGNEVAALSLIGQQSSWRPVSMSPSRTLASLLSIVPAVFCFYAVARLDLHERRLVLATIVVMAVAGAWLGAFQVVSRGSGDNFYPQHSTGWVTGFQANRNAEADVLLIAILALAVLVVPYFTRDRRRLPLNLTHRAFALFVGGLGLFLLAATVMTGSRAGIALVSIAGAGSVVAFTVSREGDTGAGSRTTALLLLALLLLGCVAAFVALSQNTAIARVAGRLSDLGSERTEVWQDSWFALKQYWPVGFGMGGFEPAMVPAERLEYLVPPITNRAHNDFIEIGIEAGILGYAMVVAASISVVALASRAWRKMPEARAQVVFGLTVLLLIALHSVVDYPVRSMAVACLSGVAGALLVGTRTSRHRSKEFKRVKEARGLA